MYECSNSAIIFYLGLGVIVLLAFVYIFIRNTRNYLKNFSNKILISAPFQLVALIFSILIIVYLSQIKECTLHLSSPVISYFERTGLDSVLINLIQWGLGFTFLSSLYLTILFHKSIIRSIRDLWFKDFILKTISSDFLDEVMNSPSPILYNSGIKHIINGLKTIDGVEIYTHHFIKLLRISASLIPDSITGCWNTVWYPLDEVYKIDDDDNRIIVNDKWIPYIESLDDAYGQARDNNKNKRILLVQNSNEILRMLQEKGKNPNLYYWIHFFEEHKKWKVHDIYLINEKEVGNRLIEHSHPELPKWLDFAIFKKKGILGNNKSWVFAQKSRPEKNGKSNVIYDVSDNIATIEDYLTDYSKWHSIIHLKIKNNIIMKMSLSDKSSAELLDLESADLKKEALSSAIAHRNEYILGRVWKRASQIYHTQEEKDFIKEYLKEHQQDKILDSSFGTGFPIKTLNRSGFDHLYATDLANNISWTEHNLEEGVHYFVSSFQTLPEQKPINVGFDVILCIGASLSYCQSWDISVKKEALDAEELHKAIEGLKKSLSPTGKLIIGNAKAYVKSKNEEVIPFYDIDGEELKMKWEMKYDWINHIKEWRCTLYDDVGNIDEVVELFSHLFDKEELVELAQIYFEEVNFQETPEGCPEYFIVCKKPK